MRKFIYSLLINAFLQAIWTHIKMFKHQYATFKILCRWLHFYLFLFVCKIIQTDFDEISQKAG